MSSILIHTVVSILIPTVLCFYNLAIFISMHVLERAKFLVFTVLYVQVCWAFFMRIDTFAYEHGYPNVFTVLQCVILFVVVSWCNLNFLVEPSFGDVVSKWRWRDLVVEWRRSDIVVVERHCWNDNDYNDKVVASFEAQVRHVVLELVKKKKN